jgi:hypothetical protein
MPRSSQLPPARSVLWLGSCNLTYWGELHWNTPASDCRIGFARSALCWTLRVWEPSNCWSWPQRLYLSWSCHIISVMIGTDFVCLPEFDRHNATWLNVHDIDKQYFKQYQQLPTMINKYISNKYTFWISGLLKQYPAFNNQLWSVPPRVLKKTVKRWTNF